MLRIVSLGAHYTMILVVLFYAFLALSSIGFDDNKTMIFKRKLQKSLILVFQFFCFFTLYLQLKEIKIVSIYISLLGLTIFYPLLMNVFYPKRQKFLENHLLFFYSIGIVVLCRLKESMALKQFLIGAVGLLLFSFLPALISKWKMIEYLGGIYAIVGMALLSLVFFVGVNLNGASNWIKIGPITLQPSEFVKILFACCLASLLRKETSFVNVFKIAMISGMHVLVLVAEKDLGGAFLFFLVFLMTVFIATNNYIYFFGGLIGVIVIVALFYQMFSDSFFSHVKVRMLAWKEPFSYIDNEGYQISQSLFGIGTGGFIGFGLGKGLPSKIPYAETDFVFSSICEEMGGIIGICLILVEISFFFVGLHLAMKMKKKFHKNLAVALLLSYQIQVMLNIGGVTKFIPSTGVTLPFISYGGSSLLSSIILYYFLQGLTLIYDKEVKEYEEEQRRYQEQKNREQEEEKIKKTGRIQCPRI